MKKLLVGSALMLMLTSHAAGHGEQGHGAAENFVPANLDQVENAFGRTGDPDEVDRTVEITMNDEMRFVPDEVRVRQGETIRFLVANAGETLHEMVIGRTEDLLQHAELMERFPDMEHAEPFMAHAKEGQTAEIVWTFTKPGTFEFGCLVPGHFDAGMRGTITVEN